MYDRVVIRVRIIGEKESFPFTIGLHQGLDLSPCLFVLVIDEFARHMQEDVPWPYVVCLCYCTS